MANFSGAQNLPPKMTAEFAKLAKDGKADLVVAGLYVFFRGNQIIDLVNLKTNPAGTVRKARPGEINQLRVDAAKMAEEKAKVSA